MSDDNKSTAVPPFASVSGYASPFGRVTLYCGDCRELLPHLGKIDAVITDQPYKIGYNPSESSQQGILKPKTTFLLT